MPLLRVMAFCVVLAIAVQSGQCPLDACDEYHVGQAAAFYIGAAEAGACHNCICIGTAFLQPTRVLQDDTVAFAALRSPDLVTEAHAGEPFLPPRASA